jgi:hypothetical protein
MPGENETFEGGLDAVAESLFVGSEDAPVTKTPANPSNRVAEGDDQVGEDDVDNSVDLEDVDLLEGDDTEEDYADDVQVDPDDVEYDVTVDGAPTKAKLKELKAAYSGNKAIEQRVQQASEYRKQQEVVTTELMKQLNATHERLTALDSILAQAEQPEVDLEQLRRLDPSRYLLEKDKIQETQNRRRQVQQAAYETQQQQRALMAKRQEEFAAEQADILMKKMPELKNAESARKLSENWNKTGRAYGFNDEEIASIVDHRHLLVLTDAMKYRALVEAKNARQGKAAGAPRQQPKPLLRPGSQNFGAKMNAVKAEKAALARAAQSGSIDDVAATLLVSAPRARTKQTGY